MSARAPFSRHVIVLHGVGLSSSCPSRSSSIFFPTAYAVSARGYIQHRETIYHETHGAGYVKHQSIADPTIPSKVAGFHNLVRAVPAADLSHTDVDAGLGTGDDDPYQRTLPNMPSEPPESTTISPASSVGAPSVEEVGLLSRRWLALSCWLAETFPRLPIFVEEQRVPDALPVSTTARQLFADFRGSVIPSLLEHNKVSPLGVEELQKWWDTAVEAYDACKTVHVFHRHSFLTTLNDLHNQYKKEIEQVSESFSKEHRSQMLMALEVLRRQTILAHNEMLEECLELLLRPSTDASSFVASFSLRRDCKGSANQVWKCFLDALERCKRQVFVRRDEVTLVYALEALLNEDVLQPPSMSAPVALFFTLATQWLEEEAGVKNAVPHQASSSELERYVRLVPVISRRRFVVEHVSQMLSKPILLRQFASILQSRGLYELYRDLSICEAMHEDTALRLAEAESLVEPFEAVQEVKQLFSNVYGGTEVQARHHLCTVLQIPTSVEGRGVQWDAVLEDVQWTQEWRRLGIALLADSSFLSAAHYFITNTLRAKSSEVRRIFHTNYNEMLATTIRTREQRAKSRKERTNELMMQVASYEMVDVSLAALIHMHQGGSDISLELLDREAAEMQEKMKKKIGSLPPQHHSNIVAVVHSLLPHVLHAVGQRHPAWVKSGVIPQSPSLPSLSTPLEVLRLLARIFIRLAYVPHAGAAMIAQRTRHRIGPVGLEATQFNVPTEFGLVEQFDNLLYKRYDWQGWYQRMVDIHNRNVSIRCRIDDLKRLDSNGLPFVDLQTERRLRILCGNRVGVGVLKLDSDKYEDQKDNITFGTTKLSEILADSRKAQLGLEYWPTVEVKVRRPSGQSQAYYSTIDNDRIEETSKILYQQYKERKKKSLFVTPMDLWLRIKGSGESQKTMDSTDEDGYSVSTLTNQDDGGKSK